MRAGTTAELAELLVAHGINYDVFCIIEMQVQHNILWNYYGNEGFQADIERRYLR